MRKFAFDASFSRYYLILVIHNLKITSLVLYKSVNTLFKLMKITAHVDIVTQSINFLGIFSIFLTFETTRSRDCELL